MVNAIPAPSIGRISTGAAAAAGWIAGRTRTPAFQFSSFIPRRRGRGAPNFEGRRGTVRRERERTRESLSNGPAMLEIWQNRWDIVISLPGCRERVCARFEFTANNSRSAYMEGRKSHRLPATEYSLNYQCTHTLMRFFCFCVYMRARPMHGRDTKVQFLGLRYYHSATLVNYCAIKQKLHYRRRAGGAPARCCSPALPSSFANRGTPGHWTPKILARATSSLQWFFHLLAVLFSQSSNFTLTEDARYTR